MDDFVSVKVGECLYQTTLTYLKGKTHCWQRCLVLNSSLRNMWMRTTSYRRGRLDVQTHLELPMKILPLPPGGLQRVGVFFSNFSQVQYFLSNSESCELFL